MKRVVKKLFKMFGYTISGSTDQAVYTDPIVEQKKLFGTGGKIVVFDVGAHVGQTTLLYNHFFKNSTIYAFEPFLESFNILKQNAGKYPNIKIFNTALGNKIGMVDFHVNNSTYTNSILSTHQQAATTWGENILDTKETIKVKSTTLDDFIEKMNIEQIDILKIDTQGTEYYVIEGALKSIEKEKIRLVYLEILTMPTYKDQKYFDEVLSLLRLNGFHLYNLYNFSNTALGELRQIDAIFLSDKFYLQLHNSAGKLN